VAVLAIYGDWYRSIFAAPRLSIEPHDLTGYKAKNAEGRTMIFFFFKVKNSRHWSPAKGVRVVLSRLERRLANNSFQVVATSVPFQFCWSPTETSEVVQMIADERIFDLGYLLESEEGGDCRFWPRWYSYPMKQDFFQVKPGEVVRYHLLPVGENFHCAKSTVVEVAWDGEFTQDLHDLAKHIQIQVIESDSG
jgi:hypothetical protein